MLPWSSVVGHLSLLMASQYSSVCVCVGVCGWWWCVCVGGEYVCVWMVSVCVCVCVGGEYVCVCAR